MAAALKQMKAAGDTALYDAIQRGIEMVDAAPADSEATRGVVVVTDGRATGGLKGAVSLDRLIQMQSTAERPIARCSGFEGDNVCFDDQGQRVGRGQVIGTGLAIATRHRVHVFFVGIGPDVDLEVGRMLAEATGAAYAPATDAALDKVLEQFGKYF